MLIELFFFLGADRTGTVGLVFAVRMIGVNKIMGAVSFLGMVPWLVLFVLHIGFYLLMIREFVVAGGFRSTKKEAIQMAKDNKHLVKEGAQMAVTVVKDNREAIGDAAKGVAKVTVQVAKDNKELIKDGAKFAVTTVKENKEVFKDAGKFALEVAKDNKEHIKDGAKFVIDEAKKDPELMKEAVGFAAQTATSVLTPPQIERK